MPQAYSYLRYSSPQQAAGDSARRQTEATADWCRRHGVQLDTSLSLRDEGVSAFKGRHRTNPDRHALAAFLCAVKSGRVPAGSFLVVESLDRLSREDIRPALTLLLNLIDAGVRVVQLVPVEALYDEKVEPMQLMMAIMELNRGHSESATKSVRVGAAWRARRDAARRGEALLTRRLPGWLREEGGRAVLVPERAEVVRQVYKLALEGHTDYEITRRLNGAGTPPLSPRAREWGRTAVRRLLTTRAVLGEFQPRQGRKPAGDPIPDYFPRLIEADLFHAVQGVLAARAPLARGRPSRRVNLFAGLLRDASDPRHRHFIYDRRGDGRPVLVPAAAKHAQPVRWSSFAAAPFERAVLGELREVPASAVAADRGGAALKVEAAAARMAEADGLIARWQAKMDDPAIVDVVAAKLSELTARRKVLAEKLAAAQQEAASPVAESWGAFRSLAELMADDPSDALREKVRSALRRSVEALYCLFTAAGPVRLAAVRVQFRNSAAHRDYVICYDPRQSNGRGNRPGRWSCCSFADTGLAAGDLDLRKPEHAADLAATLAQLDPADLAAG
jgi:DNA invertase Pin-like site-specific DNA recombinase